MAIKQLIELIGDDIVLAKLRNLGKEAGQALGAVGTSDFKLDAKPIEDFTGKTLKLKDALHTLSPILKTAGLQIGELGAFARLASGNVVLLGVAVAGAVTVGLAKLGENALRTKGQLDDAFGGRGRGQQALAQLSKQAQEFGSTVAGLAPGLESFQAALDGVDRTAKGFVALKAEDLPGASLAKDADKVSQAYGNFIKLLRAGRLTQDEAEKSAKAFFDTMKDGGPVTSAALKALPVGTINELKTALGLAGVTTKTFFAAIDEGQITIDKFQQALLNFGPQAQKAFDTKAIKTMGDELAKLGAIVTKGGAGTIATGALAAVNFVLEQISGRVAKVLELIGDAIEKAKSLAAQAKLSDTSTFVGPTLEQAGLGKEAGFRAPFPTPEQAGRGGEEAAKSFVNSSGQIIGKSAPQLGEDFATGIATGIGKTVTNQFFTTELPQAIAEPINEGLRKAVTEFSAGEDTAAIVESFRNTGQQSGINFVEGFNPVSGQIQSLAQSWWESVKAVFSTPIPVNFEARSPLESTAPFAAGGMVRGPGSGTSDSILAWLSNREYVVNARAVSHYGPDLFAALNAMRLPRDFMSRFAMGGLARSLGGNRFAAGGQVRSGNPVVLKIDRQSFNMTAGDDTITQLKRFAVTAQLSSSGRKPRWVR